MSCSMVGCKEVKVAARGMCWKHYRRELRHGDPNVVNRKEAGVCSVPGCDTRTYGHGVCQAHYNRMKYAERSSKGLCVTCGRVNHDTGVRCKTCADKKREERRRSQAKKVESRF